MARGAGLTLEIDPLAPRLLPGAEALAREGVRTGASVRNWDSYGADVRGADDLDPWRRDLLSDPQTSGGLLLSVPPNKLEDLMASAASLNQPVWVIGEVTEGNSILVE
jgi:selenide,water dikinase